MALLRARLVLENVEANGEEKIGIDILRKSLEEPLKWIANNAGKEGSVIVEEVKKLSGNQGYNAADDRFEDMVEAGIIDPTKVTRFALQNAASAAAMFLTTEAVVTDLPKKEEDHAHGAMPGMGF